MRTYVEELVIESRKQNEAIEKLSSVMVEIRDLLRSGQTKWITTKQAAKILSRSEKSVRNWAKQGRFQTVIKDPKSKKSRLLLSKQEIENLNN